ncbi:MAG: GGDEF domain-containing protein [Ruminococcaceae bacterium]|nr:GGDEF domain-containing protein [Oscillospiraceae bacterium]
MKTSHTKYFYLRLSIIIVAILVIIISSIVLSNDILDLQEETCNRTLNDTIVTLTEDLHHNLYGHRVYLQSIAAIITDYSENMNDNAVLGILQDYESDAIVNRLDILLPNGQALTPTDDMVQPDPKLSFDALKDKSYGLTGKLTCHMKNVEDGHEHEIACIHTPIYDKDGEVIGILLGVIELERLNALVDTDIFSGKAKIYIIDGSTGDILVDTGHSGMENIWNWRTNPLQGDYSKDQLTDDIKNGRSGQVKFEAEGTGVSQYFCYAALEKTDWVVGIAVEESAAFAPVDRMRGSVVSFFIIVIACLSTVLFTILYHTNAIHKKTKMLSEIDLLTECYNRNKYELDMAGLMRAQGDYLGCVYVDVNGLREHNNQSGHDQGDLMLRIISEHIRKRFGNKNTYRIGGDEFVVILRNRTPDIDHILEQLNKDIERVGYSVAIGFAEQDSTRDALALTRLAEQIMYKKKSEYYQNLNKTHD